METLSREITREVPLGKGTESVLGNCASSLHEGRTHAGAIKDWAHAARIVFAMSPNSASCERVFSLLNLMYGDQQVSTLADSIRAGLMLRYNGRKVG